MKFSKQGFCSCDRRCRILGDCCADAPRECFGAENDDSKNLLPSGVRGKVEFESIRSNEHILRLKRGHVKSESTLQDVYYSFVHECPHSAPYENDCINNVLYKSPAHHIRVCHPDSSLLFYNRFCAACNGYRMEDTFSLYQHLEVCDSWLALNYTMENLVKESIGVNDLYHLCPPFYAGDIPNVCRAIAERRRVYDRVVRNNQKKPSLCTSFVNPVVTKNELGQAVIMKNPFCLENMSAPWHCYDGKLRPYIGDADISNDTVVVWVNKSGDVVVSPPNSGYDDTATSVGDTSLFHSPVTIVPAIFLFVCLRICFKL